MPRSRSPQLVRPLAVGLAATAALAVTGGAPAADADVPTPTDRTLVVVPHPDDEWTAWSQITRRPQTYPVFVLLTRGEETAACVDVDTPTTAGAAWYQGPGSPVGQPDLGETMPSPFPWVGRDTPACAAARLTSWHTFLDRMAAGDVGMTPGGTDVEVCFDGDPADGPPTRVARDGTTTITRCATVRATSDHARVVFDLGDGDLRSDEVLWALEQVREAPADELGLPDLPEDRLVAAAYANDDPQCSIYLHPDHVTLRDTIWERATGDRSVSTCATDPYATSESFVPEAVTRRAFLTDGDVRLGASVQSYGWLEEAYFPVCDVSTDCSNTFHRHQVYRDSRLVDPGARQATPSWPTP